MANNDVVTGDLNYADRLWNTADALRGQVDSAEYKHVVQGLLFLKYISDSFKSRSNDLRAATHQTSRRTQPNLCSSRQSCRRSMPGNAAKPPSRLRTTRPRGPNR